MKQEVRYLKHETREGVFEERHIYGDYFPELLNYTASTRKRNRWRTGQILHCFVNRGNGMAQYITSFTVGDQLKKNNQWIVPQEKKDEFFKKIVLDKNGKPLDDGSEIFDLDYYFTDLWEPGQTVDWARDKNGNNPRGWISKKSPTKVAIENFSEYKCVHDFVCVPFSKISKMVYDQRIRSLISVPGIYHIESYCGKYGYVGSAYSENGGFLSRIMDYLTTGHGGNKIFKEMVLDNLNFLMDGYHITFLNDLSGKTTEQIIKIESQYKKKLVSNLNRN
jgi:hypothetical protein